MPQKMYIFSITAVVSAVTWLYLHQMTLDTTAEEKYYIVQFPVYCIVLIDCVECYLYSIYMLLSIFFNHRLNTEISSLKANGLCR